MNDPRHLMPVQILDGVLVRSDGVAVGLVGGGAPSWDLLAPGHRLHLQQDYHQLLCTLQAPIDVYVVDAPTSLADEVVTMLQAQDRAANSVQAAILGELADELSALAAGQNNRAKQIVWALPGQHRPAARSVGLAGLLPGANAKPAVPAGHQPMIAAARSAAARWADGLAALGGSPHPRLLTAEEIARLVYQLADPVRAQRYPLSGTIFERVRRAITID